MKGATSSANGFVKLALLGFLLLRIIEPNRGSGQEYSQPHGSGRIESEQEVFRGGRNLKGRVGSGQDVSKISRVGSGHGPRDTGRGSVHLDSRVFFADPQVGPADPARGSDTSKSPLAARRPPSRRHVFGIMFKTKITAKSTYIHVHI